MNNESIKEKFNGYYTMPVGEFLKMTEFKELKSWDMSGRDDITELYIGIVDGRYFWFKDDDGHVWNHGFGFLDEMKPEHS